MNPQKPLKKETVHDRDMANRFRQFRIKHISPLQADAAEAIPYSQGLISAIEAGKRGIGYSLVKKIIAKYNLNEDWLRTGIGDMIQKNKPDANGLMGKTIKELIKANQDLEGRIAVMERSIKILEANNNAFIRKIESFIKNQEKI